MPRTANSRATRAARAPSAAALVVLLVALLAAGCAALPPRPPVPPAFAIADDGASTLARVAVASLGAAEPTSATLSGIRLVPSGTDALGARLGLVRRAERSVDVQTFQLDADEVGRALLRELRDAAARGVRVRLLVDDLDAAGHDTLLSAFDAQPNVEVRVFNPLPARTGTVAWRFAVSLVDFGRINRRMHNKLFVVDGALALVGGRNIADEYFMLDRAANFIDMDALVAGPVVPELAAAFDRYWNSEPAWPLAALVAAGESRVARALRQRAFETLAGGEGLRLPDDVAALPGQLPVEQELAAGRVRFERAPARVIVDAPEKVLGDEKGRPTAMGELLEALSQADREVVIVSPYFVPGAIGMERMREARARGVRVRAYTNSMGSTDQPLVHERYARYRRAMLELGVELYEVAAHDATGFGTFGRSISRLHAKGAWIDGRRVFVGSVNLSGRSSIENTEVGILVDSPAIAGQVEYLIGRTGIRGLMRVQLAPDGALEWLSLGADGTVQVTRDEPGGSAWARLKAWIASWFVDERWL